MKKQSALLILSSLFLLASCGEPAPEQTSSAPFSEPSSSEVSEPSSEASEPSSSEASELPSSEGISSSEGTSSEESSQEASSEPSLTAEEIFKANYATYKAKTLAAEGKAISASYVNGEKTYSSSFYKGEAIQSNPNGIKIVRAVNGSRYEEFRFQDETLIDHSSVELTQENSKEYQRKAAYLFVENSYGLSGRLEGGLLDSYLTGGEGYSYAFENEAFTLTRSYQEEGESHVESFLLTLQDEAIASLSYTLDGASSYSYSYQSGDKQEDPNKMKEEDFYFTDFEVSLLEGVQCYVGNELPISFTAVGNLKASTLIDPIAPSQASTEDYHYTDVNGNRQIRFYKAGDFQVEFASSHGVKKNLSVHIEAKPINGIELNQSDRAVYQGATLDLSATILPTTAENLYTVELTAGQAEADLAKKESGDGYTLSVHEDATIGAKITALFTSVALKQDGTHATASVTFTVQEKQTGSLEDTLLGMWSNESFYGTSTITFKEDKTAFAHYFSTLDGAETYFSFTWSNATEAKIVDDNSFKEVDENGDDAEYPIYDDLEVSLQNGELTLTAVSYSLGSDDPMTLTKDMVIDFGF